MKRNRMLLILSMTLLLILLVSIGGLKWFGRLPNKTTLKVDLATPRVDTKEEDSRKRIEVLIESLALQGEPSSTDPKDRMPRGQAIDELMLLGVQAFPALIDHFEDGRLSFTEEDMSGKEARRLKCSVGKLCRRIVESQVKKYVPWNRRDPRGSPGYSESIVPFRREAALEWQRENSGSSLWELQRDNLRFVVTLLNERLKGMAGDSLDAINCKDTIVANEMLIEKLEKDNIPLPSYSPRPYTGK